jgi:hypothetical protein
MKGRLLVSDLNRSGREVGTSSKMQRGVTTKARKITGVKYEAEEMDDDFTAEDCPDLRRASVSSVRLRMRSCWCVWSRYTMSSARTAWKKDVAVEQTDNNGRYLKLALKKKKNN